MRALLSALAVAMTPASASAEVFGNSDRACALYTRGGEEAVFRDGWGPSAGLPDSPPNSDPVLLTDKYFVSYESACEVGSSPIRCEELGNTVTMVRFERTDLPDGSVQVRLDDEAPFILKPCPPPRPRPRPG